MAERCLEVGEYIGSGPASNTPGSKQRILRSTEEKDPHSTGRYFHISLIDTNNLITSYSANNGPLNRAGRIRVIHTFVAVYNGH